MDTDVQAGSIPIWLTFITFVRGRSAHAARWPVSTSVRDSLALLRSRWGDTMIPFVGGFDAIRHYRDVEFRATNWRPLTDCALRLNTAIRARRAPPVRGKGPSPT